MSNKITRFLLIASAIGIISLLFPRFQKIDVNCVAGQVWEKEDYRAPFDFELKKSEQTLKNEKEQLELNFPIVLNETSIDYNEISRVISNSDEKLIDRQTELKTFIEAIYQKPVTASKFESSRNSVIIFKEGEQSKQKIGDISAIEDIKTLIKNKLIDLQVNNIEGSIANWGHKIVPNYKVDNNKRNDLIQDKLAETNIPLGTVKKGQSILRQGEVITQDDQNKIQQLKVASVTTAPTEKLGGWLKYLGYFILTILTIGVLLLFVRKYYNKIYLNLRELGFILIWPVLFSLLIFSVEKNASLSVYMIPFCIVPIIVKTFYNEILAVFVHIVVVLIASYLSFQGYEFTFLQIFAGIFTVLVMEQTRFLNKFFIGISLIFLAYVLAYAGLSIINSSGIESEELPAFGWLVLNAFLLLMAYPLIPLLEKVFGFTSNITLAELADMNNPLLKELSLKAPGTLQHSLQVANLSEAAADKIGANSLLIKTAALYHDIGKLNKPEYYIENSGGSNPHNTLNDNFESARIIIDHVIEGEKIAKKAKLPQVIIDFITTHHGDTRVEYFFRQQKNAHPDKEIDESFFRYPGPKPRTKEQTILMIADTVEAASKSLKNPTGQDIDLLVDNLVQHKIEHGQLEDSDLNFKELEACTHVFKSLLRSIYHVRVEYPEEVKSTQQ